MNKRDPPVVCTTEPCPINNHTSKPQPPSYNRHIPILGTEERPLPIQHGHLQSPTVEPVPRQEEMPLDIQHLRLNPPCANPVIVVWKNNGVLVRADETLDPPGQIGHAIAGYRVGMLAAEVGAGKEFEVQAGGGASTGVAG